MTNRAQKRKKTYCRVTRLYELKPPLNVGEVYEYHVEKKWHHGVDYIVIDIDDVNKTMAKITDHGEPNLVMFDDYFEKITDEEYIISKEAEKFNF